MDISDPNLTEAVAHAGGGRACCGACSKSYPMHQIVYGIPRNQPWAIPDHYCHKCADLLGVKDMGDITKIQHGQGHRREG